MTADLDRNNEPTSSNTLPSSTTARSACGGVAAPVAGTVAPSPHSSRPAPNPIVTPAVEILDRQVETHFPDT